SAPVQDKVAIIGMSGRYPQASNLQEYWNNLIAGKNSIAEIPPSRWDVNQYYDQDPTKKGKVYCKWLGLLDDIDCFDPLFFQISPAEAESMDPQHRLFMQESYRAFEDAGYSNKTLGNKKCGVYLGIMSCEYSFLLSKVNSSSVDTTGNSFAIGAARISYYLNLKGPAIPIDTACSSSLVGIHLACQSLLNHEIDMALTGGVSLYLTAESYLGMCQAGMLSPEGQCKAFDDSANGFVPGEGVGALVLKRLSDAEADNDFIYGVILGSGINQDGKTNGITAPSVNSQIELEREIYEKYNINPETISYVETHGTGTKLGDPIELEALGTVFSEKTSKKNYCALGSVKSNIGHTSGAAGVASVQKVLLSMRHKTIAPSLNVKKENTFFDFGNSPFYISKEKHAWEANPNSPRRASVSAFGFSGTNAHLVIEEYTPPKNINSGVSYDKDVSILLSARTAEQLQQRAKDLLEFLVSENTESATRKIDLNSIAYTLQVGREAMKERLGIITSSVAQLINKLRAYLAQEEDIEDLYQGQVTRDKDTLALFSTDVDLRETIDKWIARKNHSKLLDLWVKGLDLDWTKFYSEKTPQRIGLPTYPFAKEKYWVDLQDQSPAYTQKDALDEIIYADQQVVESMQKMFFFPEWKSSSLVATKEKQLLSGPILILDTTDTLYLSLKAQYGKSVEENSLIWVKLGDTYEEKQSGIFTVNPDREENFYQLVENLKAQGKLPRHIIHQGLDSGNLWRIKSHQKNEYFTQQLQYGFYALAYLCKALITQKHPVPLQILSTYTHGSKISSPQNEALGAFFKTLSLENPKYLTKVVGIQSDADDLELFNAEKTNLILDEFQDKNWDINEVRYRLSKEKQTYSRYVKQLATYNPADRKIDELPLKQQGVYIITGGLGGLGFIFSEYLAKNFQAKLVLVGRSSLK
ncbi:MAG: KR domain-containing protein, partial [Chitinophagaceae bacterium]